MKVAYVTRAPFISGAERSLQTLIEFAPRAGIEPHVICPRDSPLVGWCRDHAVPYSTAPLASRDRWRPWQWVRSVATVGWILRREHVDILHCNKVWCFPAASAAAGLLHIPRICHMRDEVPVSATQWCCRSGIEAVVCISQHITAHVRPAWPDPTTAPIIETIMNPIAPAEGGPARNAQPSLRQKLKIGSDTVVMGFAGQVTRPKGLLALIDALAMLEGQQGWHLLVAGRDSQPGAPYETECRQRVKDLGLADRVTFLGFINDLTMFYDAISVAVVPSFEEPLGRVPLEAASFGKPSVAFATGGLGEVVAHGDTGWLVPTGDLTGLYAALSDIIDRPHVLVETGQRARSRAAERCDPVRHVRTLRTLYERLRAKTGSAGGGRS